LLVVLAALGCLLLGSTGGAVAGALITGKQIKDGSLTGKDVKDKSLGSAQLAPATLAQLTGPAGQPGAAGAPGQPGYQRVESSQVTLAGGASQTYHLTCPAGTTSLGGAFRLVSGPTPTLSFGGPNNLDAWDITVANPAAGSATFVPYVTCTRP
jgi:hypothetical protein